jgi:hypothetical protein
MGWVIWLTCGSWTTKPAMATAGLVIMSIFARLVIFHFLIFEIPCFPFIPARKSAMGLFPLSLKLNTRMKTLKETAAQETATVVEAPQGNASKEMAPEEPKATPAIIQIGRMKIDLEVANKALHAASCKAGNLSKLALANGIGRVAKDMSGGGTLIPTVSSLADMKAKGLLGETDSKEGKAIVQLTIEQVKALNMIVDGFTMFGLCKRS